MFFITAKIIHTREDALRLGREKLEAVEKQTKETQDAINKEFGIDDEDEEEMEPAGKQAGPMSEPLEEERILPPAGQEKETAPLGN